MVHLSQMISRTALPSRWSEAVHGVDRRRLRVKVTPGASQSRVAGIHDRYLKVRVTAPPERGKANRMVEKLLSAETGMSARVTAGHSSRLKEVEFTPRRDNL